MLSILGVPKLTRPLRCLLFSLLQKIVMLGQAHILKSQSVSHLLTANKLLISLYLDIKCEVVAFLVNCSEFSC